MFKKKTVISEGNFFVVVEKSRLFLGSVKPIYDIIWCLCH